MLGSVRFLEINTKKLELGCLAKDEGWRYGAGAGTTKQIAGFWTLRK